MPGQLAANENRLRLTPVTSPLRFGITLSNRGVLLGLSTPRDLLRMADVAESCPLIDSVWVGDALFVNRRLDGYYGANYTHERLKTC
jgi:hypothetical protein